MATGFTRQLGSQSGTQLNPLQDNSAIPSQDNYDQIFAIAMRATRGRIDKPFSVNRGNVLQKLGNGEQIRVNALNEAWVHVVEALNNGAYQAVIQRLVPANASSIRTIVAFNGSGVVLGTPTIASGSLATIPITNGGTGYGVAPQVTITGGGGTGARATANVTNGVITGFSITGGTGYTSPPTVTISQAPTFAVMSAAAFATLATPYVFAIEHLECHNDGIQINWRADELRALGSDIANSTITIEILDSSSPGVILYEFIGSLVAGSVDDYGNSTYLPDVLAAQTDAVLITVGSITSISTTSLAYGYNSTAGQQNWAQSGVLVAFTEGGTAYATSDYANAVNALQNTNLEYGFISSGGSQSPALLSQLAQLAFNTNVQLRFDVPGADTIDAAITFIEQLNFGANQTAHLLQAFWAPLKSVDPTGINGVCNIGVATLNIAYACGRNAKTDTNEFAAKNYPIAGKNWPINRTGIIQTYTPDDQDLNALALAKINPCIYSTYTGGGRYVFFDSLTQAPVTNSLKKLIAVVDMSASIDQDVVTHGNDIMQLPMANAVKSMTDYLKKLFKNAQTAEWIVPSSDPFMQGQAFQFTVAPNANRPYDRMDVNYWLRYDGTVRAIYATQTLSK